jgi:PAS domain S-box-containing protein
MFWFKDNKQTDTPLAQAIFVFLILSLMLLFLVFLYDFSNTDMVGVAFVTSLTSVMLLARYIYDLARNDVQIEKRAKSIARDLIHPSQELFSEVYHNSPVAYIILNEEGTVMSANTSATRLLKSPLSRLSGNSFFSCIKTEKTEHLTLLKEKFYNGVVVSNEEIEIEYPKERVWVTLSILQYNGKMGEKMRLVTLVDITKQKEIDIAKSEFVSLASHQLRTPIAGMRWSAELLLMGEGDDSLTKQQRKYTDRLLSNIKRMGSLVDDFLQVSRFDLGTRTLRLEVTSVEDVFEEVIKGQMIASTGKKIQINKKYDKQISEITTDVNLLRMIVLNLYTNAIKYSHIGGSVDILYKRKGDDLIIQIKDTGMGIPVSEQDRIFTKVYRATNAMREVPDGTGLGLYIVQRAVHVLRGKITFVSEENIGSTFTVVIPLNIQEM